MSVIPLYNQYLAIENGVANLGTRKRQPSLKRDWEVCMLLTIYEKTSSVQISKIPKQISNKTINLTKLKLLNSLTKSYKVNVYKKRELKFSIDKYDLRHCEIWNCC